MEIKQCWQKNSELNAFTLPIRVTNAISHKSLVTYCIFDTGFTGYFGLTLSAIEELKLEKIGEGKAATVTGDIDYVNYSAEAELLDSKNQPMFRFQNIDSDDKGLKGKKTIPVQVFRLPLIGIRAIEQLNWMILSSTKILCSLL